MPIDDLDLEFEDEEDLKKKRNNEMVHQDVDIEFGASPTVAAKAAPAQVAPKSVSEKTEKTQIISSITKTTPGTIPRPSANPAPSPQGQVKRLDEARAALKKPASSVPTPSAAARPSAAPMTNGSSALDLNLNSDFEEAGLAQLAADLETTKFEARVQVAVAEFKTEILADVLSDVKLLDHQVHQLLVRINQKHPDLKPEVMALKKLLADFAAKKRK